MYPEVVSVLREAELDLFSAVPLQLTAELAVGAALLVTTGCGEECPVVPGVERDDWPLPDPKDQPIEAVRRTRDAIRDRVSTLVSAREWSKT